MISLLSLVTSVKDYVEIIHKLIESDTAYTITNYNDLGPIITYILLTLKQFIINFISLNWLKNIWDLPIIVPEISSAMISEISVLDGVFHNAFNFLDRPVSYGDTNLAIYSLEKFTIGLINSLFLFIPTSTAHLITLRRFMIQGLEAGYLAGLGSIAGNILWITSVIFGCRFFVIPWLSLDIFRYLLGFVLLVKYMWDSYSEKKLNLTNPAAKQKIFLLNFLLALTEQTSIYPFISNLSIGSESSILESFPAKNYLEFMSIHGFYIFGLLIGCLSLLHFTCWFWENPAFKIYMWVIASPKFKMSSNFYYKVLNFLFLYLTMISAISSIPYYGLDYTITNPLGFVHDDRILDQKLMPETSFLNTKASDRNTRRNRGRHGRRERWKRKIRKYRTFDTSLYDQGIYDLFTIEDLNYGFDRFWLRRKMRNHRVRFRFFPGGWMRSFKKQLAKPRLESYAGPRQEFFRILFEQVYHPSFHQYKSNDSLPLKRLASSSPSPFFPLRGTAGGQLAKKGAGPKTGSQNNSVSNIILKNNIVSLFPKKDKFNFTKINQNIESKPTINGDLKVENSTLRKFVRKVNTRIKNFEIKESLNNKNPLIPIKTEMDKKNLYSKRWKQIFSKISHDKNDLKTNNGQLKGLLRNFYTSALTTSNKNLKKESLNQILFENNNNFNNLKIENLNSNIKKANSKINLSKLEKQILKYRSIFLNSQVKNKKQSNNENSLNLLHPLKYYLKKQTGFEHKLRYYTPTIFRKFSIENNAPYFRVMMKRYFYYYKPTLRWERTMKVASLRKARRKTASTPKKIQLNRLPSSVFSNSNISSSTLQSKEEEKNLNSFIPYSNPFPSSFVPSSKESRETTTGEVKRRVNETHNYTIVGKRATRYRYQIYKDVLQHWYYSPFNRLLLKFDIDLFINRQPNSHFLTQNEENLLHLRRFLLSEHYNTLRWYSYMQHYRSMKTKIGGTKSFASGIYNQQFVGTFKKIRHLFAITPNQGFTSSSNLPARQGGQPILKFDQNLYNDYLNSSTNNFQKNLIIHEELISDEQESKKINLLNQSTQVVRDYLMNTNLIKQNYIKKLIQEKNYIELTKFLYKGQKTRGLKPITNQKSLINQEKEYLLTKEEKNEFKNLEKIKLEKFLRPVSLQQDLWVNLLKKWKRKINDQEFLKNYLQRRIDKREKRKQKKDKTLKLKLERLEDWLLNNPLTGVINPKELTNSLEKKESIKNIKFSTGVEKALIEGVYTLKDKNNKLLKTGERENIKENLNWDTGVKEKINQINFDIKPLSFKSLNNLSVLKKEKELLYSLNKLSNLVSSNPKQVNISVSQLDNKSVKLNKEKFILKPTNFKKISIKLKHFYINYKSHYNKLLSTNLIKILKKPSGKINLKNWQKKERSLNKEKRSRKEFKLFSKKPFKTDFKNYLEEKTDLLLNSNRFEKNPTRKKKEIETNSNQEQNCRARTKNWKSISTLLKRTYLKYFAKKFKRKKSPQRRARIRRNRGVTKKRTLSDSLKREFKNLRKYGEKIDNKKQKIYLSFNSALNKEINADGTFVPNPLQRRSKQKKQRFWKQKRSKYAQKLRKYRKRRRSILGKVRILNKQLKKIKTTTELKNWWWKNFLPNLRATTDSLWQYEKDRQIQQKLSELTIPEILERDKFTTVENGSNVSDLLQIGNFDYKPLALPETIKLMNSSEKNRTSTSLFSFKEDNKDNNQSDVISRVSEAILVKETGTPIKNNENQIFPTSTLPFYAGWDESLRKFVVTNRLLSRRESGYEIPNSNLSSSQAIKKDKINQKVNEIESNLVFTSAPLKGMNAATTLYWQIPFTTYDPDQFFALGMDGFAPLGWRRFQFRHSILKSWLYEKTSSTSKETKPSSYLTLFGNKEAKLNKTSTNNIIIKNKTNITRQSFLNDKLIYKLKEKINSNLSTIENNFQSININESQNNLIHSSKISTLDTKNAYRRLKKRYRRVKKHPRSPAWFPSGPLLNQVLPVHYIYIFYKRSRLPRDRYIKRRLRKIKTSSSFSGQKPLGIKSESIIPFFENKQIPDFTL